MQIVLFFDSNDLLLCYVTDDKYIRFKLLMVVVFRIIALPMGPNKSKVT